MFTHSTLVTALRPLFRHPWGYSNKVAVPNAPLQQLPTETSPKSKIIFNLGRRRPNKILKKFCHALLATSYAS